MGKEHASETGMILPAAKSARFRVQIGLSLHYECPHERAQKIRTDHYSSISVA